MKTNSISQLLSKYEVVIPPIQRDYAQGRNSTKIKHIRERFLKSIEEVLTDDSMPVLELDFVYGYIEKDIAPNQNEVLIFKPLDGQQRLTTLFLLHWYVAQKEGKVKEASSLLSKFTYATRHSSRSFCNQLVNYTPELDANGIDQLIANEPWFFSSWHSDPTIASMLVVLRDIEIIFSSTDKLWEKLTGDNPRIIFHLLAMEELGLPDDLYIKMNARGKELTDFEHFKSQFSEILHGNYAELFNKRIDIEWSDLFWNIFKDKTSEDVAKDVDSGFLSFFWYITDLLREKNEIQCNSDYWLDVIVDTYKDRDENIEFLFYALDLFERLEKENPGYFDTIFYLDSSNFETNKTRLFFASPQINLFRKCADSYGYVGKSNSFSVGEQLMLYAFLYMKRHDKFDPVKFRKLRNIFSSSEDQLRNEYLLSLYEDVESLIDLGTLSENSKLSKRQLEEEALKDGLILAHPNLKETIYRLEDHLLLRGNISIFSIDSSISIYAQIFHQIFTSGCNYLEISRAMLTIGNYSQAYGTLRRFGNKNSSTWRQLFTQSEYRKGFNNTKKILHEYLDMFVHDDTTSNASIIDNYLNEINEKPEQPKDWRYYYIRYDSFFLWGENQTEGFYKWDDIINRPYECIMFFKTNFRGRHWNPFLLEISRINNKCEMEDNYGDSLRYTNGDVILMIDGTNKGFKFTNALNENSSMVFLEQLIEKERLDKNGCLEIKQDENGFDIEDRIEKMKSFLVSLS